MLQGIHVSCGEEQAHVGVGVTGVRGVGRVLGGAALTVTVGVAVNQILSDGKFSWTWLYASLALAAMAFLITEVAAAPVGGVRDAVRGGRRVYLRQLRASVRDMETVGVATSGQFVLRMRQVYVDVSLVPRALHTTSGEPYLGAVPGAPAGAESGERRSLESVLRDAWQGTAARSLAVIGGPGSGKTTLARNTALALCERRWRWWPRRRRLPVLLYLRDHAQALLSDDPPGLGEVAVAAGWLEGKVSADWLERRLDRGGCVVLLDGLDEVADASDRGRVVSWVVRQTQRHPRNVYVVTSRPHGYQSDPLPDAEVLQVRRFTGEQITRFLHQWFLATESRARAGTGHEVRAVAHRSAEDLLARLRDRPALYDLAANPLLLTMTANVHRYRGQLPGSRAELYAEMCDVLLHRRYEARGLRDATGLGGPHKQHVAQHLALAMTKAKVRSWPLRDVVRAIRRPLGQVPGDVPPEVFLDAARKSGLLIEREQGIYQFAHLTLQEYLAAAQLSTPRADTTVLTGNVTEAWWRETILLWAAGNDATGIITACLDSGTVPALALAFDCADQAKIVDAGTRNRLDALLESSAPGQSQDPARRRLLAGIQAARALRETVALSDTVALCARPVTQTLYDLFVHEEIAEGRHHPDVADRTRPQSSVAAAGTQIGDAERFIDWLRIVTGDTTYRLLTPAELSDPAARMTADLSRHTIWAQDDHRTLLHQPPGAPWPYTAEPGWLRELPLEDVRTCQFPVRLLLIPPEDRARVVAWTRVLTTALMRAPDFWREMFPVPLELVLLLAHIRDLDRPSTVFSDAFHSVLDEALADAVITRGNPGRWDIPSDPQIALLRARVLAQAFAPDVAEALSGAGHLDLDHTLALALGRAGALDLTTDVFSLGPTFGPNVSDGSHWADADLPRASLELSLELATTATAAIVGAPDMVLHARQVELVLYALRLMLSKVSRPDHPDPGEGLSELIVELAHDIPQAQRLPESPVWKLRSAHEQSLTHSRTVYPQSVRLLLDRAVELLLRVHDRRFHPVDQSLSCIRIALLAAIAVLRDTDHDRYRTDISQLGQAWQSLAVHDPRAPLDLNQLLLVARTRS